MPLISAIRGLPVAGRTGRLLGTVSEVLFHPSEPRVIGLQVAPPAFLYVLSRAPRFLPLTRVAAWGAEAIGVSSRLPSKRAGEREIGAAWDDTVIWRGMPVLSQGGTAAGRVADAGFTKVSGRVTRVLLTGGAVNDVAFGAREVAGELVIGFESGAPGGGAVRVADAALDAPLQGGAVRAAGEAAGTAAGTVAGTAKAAAREAAGTAAGLAREAGIKVTAAGMAAAKMVSESQAGRTTGRIARRAWKGMRATLAEALRPDDEE